MKQLLSDWRVLSGIAILGWGLWGIMSKLAPSAGLPAATSSTFVGHYVQAGLKRV